MKILKGSPRWPVLALLALLLPVSACGGGGRNPGHEADGVTSEPTVIITDPVPVTRSEVIVDGAPTPDHVWVGGYWAHHGDHWRWVDGRWAARPHAGVSWVGGRWESNPRGHVWVQGRWR